ncbi:MAG: hypothetical protein V5804_10830 [Mucilaginibacter sp.]|uniref:hypothetical protein n=1 Tax=Mucilaginibacter sp. TaxID=1882438 RepID=UPI0034E58AFC
MEKLIINVPERKIALVKELLKELGVTIEQEKMDMEAYRKDLAQVSTWSEEDLKVFEENTRHFDSINPPKW